jgi:maltose-binding protein MalE
VYGPSDQVGPFTIMDLILPLDEIWGDDLFGRFLPAAFDTLGGHIYALPDQIGNHLTLVYNRALVDVPPRDTDALIATGKALTSDLDDDGRVDRYGLAMNLIEPFWLAPWLGGFGGWVMNDDREPTLDSEAMAAALRFMRDLKHEHGIMPPESSYEIMDTMFKEGRVAMIVNGPWSWQSYIDAGIELGIAPLPVVSATGQSPSPMVATKGYSINMNADPSKAELVRALMLHLTGDEVQTDLVRELRILPSLASVYEREVIAEDPILAASGEQLVRGRRMPVVVEMRAIWDSMRPELQNCINQVKSPEEAASDMQRAAVENIRSLRGES